MGVDRNALAKKVGENLRTLREQRGLTQAEVIKGIGMSTTATLSNYEQGKRLIDLDILVALSQFYSVPLEAICGSGTIEAPVTAGSFLRMMVNLCENADVPPVITTEEHPYHEVLPESGVRTACEMEEERTGEAPSIMSATITLHNDVIGRFLHDYTHIRETSAMEDPTIRKYVEEMLTNKLNEADGISLSAQSVLP